MAVLLEEHPLEHLRALVRVVGHVRGPVPEVPEDRVRLPERPPVVEHERRHAKRRVQLTEKLLAVRPIDDVDVLELVLDPELRQKQPHLVAVARDRRVVEEHGRTLPASRAYDRNGGESAARLVCDERSRPPVAADARPVRDPRQRGHAPADAGRARRAALPRLARALADGRGARGSRARRRDPRVAGARLQPARTEPAPGGPRRRRDRVAERPDRAPRRRHVHRCCDPPLRLRRRRPARRRQRRARASPDRRELLRCVGARAHGPRRDRLHRARPAVRRVPARRGVPVARHPRGAAPKARRRSKARSVSDARQPSASSPRRPGRSSHSTTRPSARSSATASSSSATAASRFPARPRARARARRAASSRGRASPRPPPRLPAARDRRRPKSSPAPSP